VPKKVLMPVKPAPDAVTILEIIDEKNPVYRRTL
jgi:hypothetical protein